MNYARELPKTKNELDVNGAPPAFFSYQSQAGVPIASSVITLSPNTTFVEISAMTGQTGNGGIIAKWGVASVTTTNFDFLVNSGFTRQVIPPVSVMGTSSVQGANGANGLYNSLSVKWATGISASVFTSEY